MAGPVTQRDIARDLGLEVTTVSKALRGHPKIARTTRERVVEAACRLGYQRNPMLSALASYREARRGRGYRATLGWIYNHGRDAQMDRFSAYAEYLASARERARELGYLVEEFWTGANPRGMARTASILRARGIGGVVVAPQATPGTPLELPWAELSAVAIGYALQSPALHTVTNDHFQTIITLLEQLKAQGCRRIGLHVWTEDNKRQQRRSLAALSAWSTHRRIPVLEYQTPDKDAFLRWQAGHRLDAVVTRHTEVPAWLNDAGVAGVTCASHALDGRSDAGWPGMSHNNHLIGGAAVDWLTRMVERGERGVPAVPLRMLVPGVWRDRDL